MAIKIDGPAFVGSGVSSLKKILLPGLPTVSLPLFRGYGLRLLNAGYSGPLVRLRRSNDNAEADFNYVTDAVGWAGSGNSAYVKVFYDHSGNGKHQIPPANNNQPRVVNAGVLDVLPSGALRPRSIFDGGDDYAICAGGQGLYAAGAMSEFGVVSGGSGTTRHLVSEGNTGNVNPFFAPARMYSATLTQQLSNDAGGNPLPVTIANEEPYVLVPDGKQFSVIDTGTVWKKWVGGVPLADVAYVRASTLTLTHLAIGASVRNTVSAFFNGALSELAFYGGVLSDADRLLIEANQNAYYGLS